MKAQIFSRFVVVLVVFISSFANAKDIWINDNSLLGDVNCTAIGNDGNSGTTNSPYLSIKKALAVAVSGDVIHVEVGTYTGTSNRDQSISVDNLTITGSGLSTSIFEGGSVTGGLFDIVASNVLIEKIKVQNYWYKGAINIASKSALDSTYINFNYCYFEKNNVSSIIGGHGGGAIYTKKGAVSHKPVSLKLLGCIFNTNEATESMKGGAVYVTNDTYLKVTKSQVVCNVNNSQSTSDGGIYYIEDSNADFIDCLISGGGAGRRGGAICMSSSTLKTVNIVRSTFYNNQGQKGSILYVGNEFNLNISNSLFYKNTLIGGFEEGGILVEGGNSSVAITNCTFADNFCASSSKTTGLKVNSAKKVDVYNTIFWGNTGPDVTAASANFSNCIVDPTGGPTYTNVTGNLTSNPLFTNSVTFDYTIQNSSPAINKGLSVTSFTNDITSTNRTGVNDIGAYESGSALIVLPTSCNILCGSATFSGTTEVCKSSTTITGIGTGNAVFQWWTKSVGGTLFHIGDTYTTSVLNADTTFYIKSSNDGCSTLVPVTITQKCTPCITTISYSPAVVCSGNTVMHITKTNSSNASATFSVSPVNAGSTAALNTANGDFDLSKITVAAKYTITMAESVSCNPTFDITVSLKPLQPTIGVVTDPTCTTSGTVQVTNYDNTQTYGFTPSTGISISGTGLITATSGTFKFAASKGGCTSDSTSVTFGAVPGKPTISGAQSICVGQSITLTGSGTALSWATSSPAIASVINAASNTTTVKGIGSGTATITYTDNSNCTQTASIQVDPTAVGGVATATSSSICTNTTTSINLVGNVGSIQWQSSPDGSTNWTNIGNATSSPYTTPTLTTGTYYYRAVITSGVCAATAFSNIVTITVSPTPVVGVASATPDTICAGNTALLTLTGSTGNIQWQQSANGTTGWVNIIGATGGTTANCTTASLNTTTFYKTILSSGACTDIESTVLKVVVNPNIAASVTIVSDKTETAGQITICDDIVTFTATPSLGLGIVAYQWKNRGKTIPLANKSTYKTSLADGDSITCEITSTGTKCITGSPALSNLIKVKKYNNDLSVVSHNTTACNALDGYFEVKGSGTGTVTWVLKNNTSVILGTHNGVTLTKNAPPFETISNLGQGNYTVNFNNGTCTFSKDGSISDPNAPQDALLSVSTNLPICQGQSVTITASVLDPLAITGSTRYYWKKDGLDYSGSVQPQLGNSITVNVAGTYSVSLVDGGCSSIDNDTIVAITATPNVPTIATSTLTYCKSDNKKVSDLSALLTNATQTITWYNLLVGGIAYNSTDVLTTGSYFAEQSEGTCISTSRLKVDVTVVDVSAPTLPGAIIQPSCLVPTGTVDINLPSSGVWDITATPVVGAPVLVTTANLTTSPFTYQFAGLNPGTYTFKVKDLNGCTSPISSSAIVQNQPTSPLTPVLDASKIYCASSTYTLDQITFNPTGSVKYYDANDVAISPKTVVVAGTTYKFTFDNGTCESKVKLSTVIPMDNGPAIAPVDISNAAIICAIDKPTFNSLIATLPITVPAGYTLLISPSPTGNPVIPNSSVIGSLGGASQTIYYNIVNDKGCQNKNFSTLKFAINEGPKDLVLKNGIQTFCASDNPTVLDLDKTKISGTGSLKWYTSDVSTTVLPSNTPLSNGTYYASVTANPGCESINRKSVIVEVQSFGQTTLDGSNDYTFCKDIDKKVSDLQTTPYPSNAIVWLNANKIVQAPNTLLIPGTYYAAETKNGCVSDNPQAIVVKFTSPTISISPKKLPTCSVGNGSFVITGANDTYTYKWSKNGVPMSETGSQIINLEDDKSIKYSVIVTDSKGCISKDTTSFTDCDPALPPHIITPNSDGKNDNFILHYDQKYPKCQLYIYNRWGALVYKSEIPYKDEWDGKSNASDALGKDVLPASTYFYMVDKGDGTDPESGYIELVK